MICDRRSRATQLCWPVELLQFLSQVTIWWVLTLRIFTLKFCASESNMLSVEDYLYISVSQLLHSTQKSVWSRVKAQRLKPGGKLKMPDWKLSPFMEESFRPQVTAATLNITLRARSLSPEEKEGSVEVLSRASLETLTLPPIIEDMRMEARLSPSNGRSC